MSFASLKDATPYLSYVPHGPDRESSSLNFFCHKLGPLSLLSHMILPQRLSLTAS
jgi:hypothetical protein